MDKIKTFMVAAEPVSFSFLCVISFAYKKRFGVSSRTVSVAREVSHVVNYLIIANT